MSIEAAPDLAEVEIVRTLDIAHVGHLDEDQPSSDGGLELNLNYFDARGWDASDLAAVLEEEQELLARLGAAGGRRMKPTKFWKTTSRTGPNCPASMLVLVAQCWRSRPRAPLRSAHAMAARSGSSTIRAMCHISFS